MQAQIPHATIFIQKAFLILAYSGKDDTVYHEPKTGNTSSIFMIMIIINVIFEVFLGDLHSDILHDDNILDNHH